MSADPLPPPAPGAPRLRWFERLDLPTVLAVLAVAAVIWAWPALRGPEGRELDHLANLRRFLAGFLPPDWSVLPAIGDELIVTLRMAVMGTAIGFCVALPLGLAGARRIAPLPLVVAVRALLAVLRTVPSILWAVICVGVFGPTPLAGTVALALYSISYLAKFAADACDSVDVATVAALRGNGASRVQALRHAFWPEIRPTLFSHGLWMLEYNIRSGAIIGFVGAGGVGTLITAYLESAGGWHRIAAVLAVILAIVLILDLVGDRLRAALLRQERG